MKICSKCKTLTNEYYNYKIHSQCKQCIKENIQKSQTRYKGVYGIFNGDECLYVGESSRLTQRISRHKQYIKNPENKTRGDKQMYYELKQYPNITFQVLQYCDNHKEQEQHYIQQLKPKYNTQHGL